MMTNDERYMKQAITQAKKASRIGDVPIGCVIVYEEKVIARGYNRRNKDKTTLAHAELIAIKKASKVLGDWRLEDCTMYITLEPCQMCAGAIVQARIPKVVVGSMNPKAGCAGSVLDLLHVAKFNHQVEFVSGVLEEECGSMLTAFFKELREKKKKPKLLLQKTLLLDEELEPLEREYGLLIGIKGTHEGREFKLYPDRVCQIGRASESDIPIEHDMVSRKHCTIDYKLNGNYEVVDDSRNGTFYNKKRLLKKEKMELRPGGFLAIGDEDNLFELK